MPEEFHPDALPPEVLEFLVRSLPSRKLWEWLNEEAQSQLRHRVAQGFRAKPEVLRQPVARARLLAHLQTSSEDFKALLELWTQDEPKVLEAVRAQSADAALIAQLPMLQTLNGGEALLLALLHEDREAVLEAWAERDETIEPPEEQAADESTSAPQIESLQKHLQRAQTKLEQQRTKAQEAKARASQTEKLLQEKLREHERAAREAIREARQSQLKLEVLQAKLDEAEKVRERSERKARSTLTETEAAQSETKILRRQVHRLQQVNEELRRRLSTREAEKAAEKPQKKKQVATEAAAPSRAPAKSVLPGLQLSVSELKAAIDRNDEQAVATSGAQLVELRERDAAAAQKVVKQVRALGRYYERVLCAPTPRVLVDASNVARHDGPGKGKLSYLHAMREELRRCEFFPILFIADASLPYHIDDPDEFRRMMKSGGVLVSASGQEADEILAREARETGAYVVTNDRNFHRHLAPNFTPSRLGFDIFDGVVILEEF